MERDLAAELSRARAAHTAGNLDAALQGYAAILAAAPGALDALDGLTAILEMARTEKFHPGLADLIRSALATPGANT
jgi:Zn-dependent M28 family amino/carboxypeptidase